MHAVEDVHHTLRTGAPPMTPEEGPQPATCWTCKSPDVPPRLMESEGIAEFYNKTWAHWGARGGKPDWLCRLS